MTRQPAFKKALLLGSIAIVGGLVGVFADFGGFEILGGLIALGALIGAVRALWSLRGDQHPSTTPAP
jgi:hypothetical protein